MTIFLVGLGLMGTAYAQKLKGLGHNVYGTDLDRQHVLHALNHQWIEKDDISLMLDVDVILLALPLEATLSFVKAHQAYFKNASLITDIAGLKVNLMNTLITLLPNPKAYVSHHPMAGYHSQGPKDASLVSFEDKKVMIIEGSHTQEAETILINLLQSLKFAQPVWVDAELHDHIVTLTSHMPHLLISSLMHVPGIVEASIGSGPSFQSVLRFANMQSELWSELLIANKPHVEKNLNLMIDQLTHIKELLSNRTALKTYLEEGSIIATSIKEKL
jgi:prephenate dehydrogenase